MEDKTLKFHARIRVYYEERSFGPGVAQLMRLVKEYGSVSAACKDMGMAYSKAWKMIKNAERDLGITLMEGTRGGESGGRTIITQEGEEFLARYTAFEEEAMMELEKLFRRHFDLGQDS